MIKEAVYKITENCPCDCSFCDSREKYEKILKRKTMSFEQWVNITDKLLSEGLEVVVVSGGEPLLNEEITLSLIKYLQQNGVFVVLNASGALFGKDSKRITNLLNSFPDLLVFSIDSISAEKHDENRNFNGLFDKVINSIKLIKSMGDYPVGIRTVITKNNYMEIPEIIKKFSSLGVDCIKLTNIENDLEGNFRLSKKDLDIFNNEVKPKIYEALKESYYEDEKLLEENIKKISKLLSNNSPNYIDISKGLFSPKLVGNAPCDLESRFIAIQSNGDVLPCCEAEHHYYPLLGNILNQNLNNIQSSDSYIQFKNNRAEYCVTCTQTHNLQLDFKQKVKKVDRR